MTTPPDYETTDPASTTTMRQIQLSTEGVELETTPNSDSAHNKTSAPTLQPVTDVSSATNRGHILPSAPTTQPDPDVNRTTSHSHNLTSTPTTQPNTDVSSATSHSHNFSSTSTPQSETTLLTGAQSHGTTSQVHDVTSIPSSQPIMTTAADSRPFNTGQRLKVLLIACRCTYVNTLRCFSHTRTVVVACSHSLSRRFFFSFFSVLIYSCDFDDIELFRGGNFCGFQQLTDDDYNWSLGRRTPSRGTGPPTDRSGTGWTK